MTNYSLDDQTIVVLEGVNGERVTLAGPDEGDQGIYLGTDPKGAFYDPPVKVTWEEPGNAPGSRYLGDRVLRRDIVFAVIILNDRQFGGQHSWLSRDSFWRKCWSFKKDCKLYVTTPESGTRYLKVRLGESPECNMKYDPRGEPLNVTTMTCVAGDPFWYEEDRSFYATTKKDTRFQPTVFDGLFPWEKLPKETLTIKVDASNGYLNPTDQDIYLTWTVPGSTEEIPDLPFPFPAGIDIPWDKAPFTQFVIPDYSFTDPLQAGRRLKLPGLVKGEDCTIDTDPIHEQISSASGSQVWARMNGVRFVNEVPAWTESKTFTIDATGCKPGLKVGLHIPRPWSRPWGLE